MKAKVLPSCLKKKSKTPALQLKKQPLKKKLLNLQNLPTRMTSFQFRQLKTTQTRKSKYGNRKTVYDGRTNDSAKEARRAGELDVLLRAGVVLYWQPQPEFKIELNGVKICTYKADFKVQYGDGRIEFEDVKGFKTAVYRLKKKLVKAFHNVDIQEV